MAPFSRRPCCSRPGWLNNATTGRPPRPPTAEADPTSWPVAHARVRLAGILEAAGDTDTAQRLYHSVVDWSETPRPHRSRETQFVVFNGSPGAAALSGLA